MVQTPIKTEGWLLCTVSNFPWPPVSVAHAAGSSGGRGGLGGTAYWQFHDPTVVLSWKMPPGWLGN